MVQTLLDLPEQPTPPDVADALALAVCHLDHRPAAPGGGRAAPPGGGVIGSLRGTVLDRAVRSDHQVEFLVDVGGVGYRVVVPAGCAGRAGEMGGPTFLHVHTHVREDAISSTGFPAGTSGDASSCCSGPTGSARPLALAILSVLSPAALQRAVLETTPTPSPWCPGSGKKTAARLVLELTPRFETAAVIDVGGRAAGSGLGEAGPGRTRPVRPTGPLSVKRSKRRSGALGYGSDEVRQALARLPVEGSTEDMLRHALRELAGSS